MRRSLLSALVVALFVSGLVLGQASFGHLHGVIRDSAGNLLPGVEVTISSGTSFRRVTLVIWQLSITRLPDYPITQFSVPIRHSNSGRRSSGPGNRARATRPAGIAAHRLR